MNAPEAPWTFEAVQTLIALAKEGISALGDQPQAETVGGRSQGEARGSRAVAARRGLTASRSGRGIGRGTPEKSSPASTARLSSFLSSGAKACVSENARITPALSSANAVGFSGRVEGRLQCALRGSRRHRAAQGRPRGTPNGSSPHRRGTRRSTPPCSSDRCAEQCDPPPARPEPDDADAAPDEGGEDVDDDHREPLDLSPAFAFRVDRRFHLYRSQITLTDGAQLGRS